MKHSYRIFLIMLALALTFIANPNPQHAYAGTTDFALSNGHFYTQAAGPSAPPDVGYAITDEGVDDRGQTIRFWSEFQRLGGVDKLGYPASRRFKWAGFTCQVVQRGVLQWRSDVNAVYLLNVMDLITEAGKDDYLLNARQTPKPVNYKPEEQGLTFQQIVAKRYALLDSNPAIKARFFSVSDPLNLNGLPTAPITDMGDAYVLRAQRIIIQQWKKDVPWAKKGDVTVALGGDIAKETGLVDAQDLLAGVPTKPPSSSTPPPAPGSNSLSDAIAAIHTLKSYEAKLSIRQTIEGKNEALDITYHVAGPTRYAMESTIVDAGQTQRINLKRIENRYWVQLPDVSPDWIPVTADKQKQAEDLAQQMQLTYILDTGYGLFTALFDSFATPQQAGKETVNGVMTTHWIRQLSEKDLGTGKADYWVADNGGYPAKMVVTYQSDSDAINLQLDVSNANGTVTVTQP